MKKYIILSLGVAIFLGFIMGYFIDLPFDSVAFYCSFRFVIFILLFILASFILMFIGLNLPLIYLYVDTFLFGILASLILKTYGISSALFLIIYLIVCKVPIYFLLFLLSFYIFKFIKHFFKFIFKKAGSHNYIIYLKKIILCNIFILIYFGIYILSFFLLNKMTNTILFDTIGL